MNLKSLEIQGLYGSLNKEVTFKPELSLLVGINGCGKTSVLNCIDWLLRLDVAAMATTPFERIALRLEHNNRELTIEAVQSAEELNVYLHGVVGDALKPFNVRFHADPKRITNDEERQRIVEMYSRLRPEPHEMPIYNAFKELPKPTVISLDRTISAETRKRVYVESEPISYRLRNSPISPITHVMQLATRRYSGYRNRMEKLNDQLKMRIVMSTLREPTDPTQELLFDRDISADEVSALESRTISCLSTVFKDRAVAEQAQAYFSRIRDLLNTKTSQADQKLVRQMLARPMMQMEELAQAVSEFENAAASAYAPIDNFLSTVNLFFAESKKRLGFNPQTNVLAFQFLTEGENPQGSYRDLKNLSSGERQVLILLAFLAFAERPKGIFIVDEPELSLHPKWQSEFLPAFLAVKPQTMQILIATHSPELVGRYKDACIVLLP